MPHRRWRRTTRRWNAAAGLWFTNNRSKLHRPSVKRLPTRHAPSLNCSRRWTADAARWRSVVRVEHIHIHPGGQAVVGNIAPGGGRGCTRNPRGTPPERLPDWRTTLPLAQSSPRCGARTRARTPCRSPAMKNGRCRLHGGQSGCERAGRRSAPAPAARRVRGSRRAAPAVPGHYGQRGGAGVRPDHRRLEAAAGAGGEAGAAVTAGALITTATPDPGHQGTRSSVIPGLAAERATGTAAPQGTLRQGEQRAVEADLHGRGSPTARSQVAFASTPAGILLMMAIANSARRPAVSLASTARPAVLLGLVGGAVLACAAGARRTDTAYGRLRHWAHASQVQLVEGAAEPSYYAAAVASLPKSRPCRRRSSTMRRRRALMGSRRPALRP